MCQPKSKGGKRCAAHHPATLAMKFEMQNSTKLQQGQIDYVFKALREEGKNHEAPSQEEYLDFLQQRKQKIIDSGMSETLKKRLVKKVDKAIENDQIPAGSTFYALQKLENRSRSTWRKVASELRDYSHSKGIAPAEAMREFKENYGSLVSSREKEDFSAGLDRKTLLALENMRSGNVVKFEGKPRIQKEPVNLRTIIAAGYDPEDGRLEIDVSNGNTYAYHSVSPEDYEQFKKTPVAVFNRLRISDDHQYENAEEAAQDAFRVWCDACKEYKLASGHVCQEDLVSGQVISSGKKDFDQIYKSLTEDFDVAHERKLSLLQMPSKPSWMSSVSKRESVELSPDDYYVVRSSSGSTSKRIVPNTEAIIEQVLEGKVVNFQLGRMIPIRGTRRTQFHMVTTDVKAYLYKGNRSIVYSFDEENLRCTCPEYIANGNGRCIHLYPHDDGQLNLNVLFDISESLDEAEDEAKYFDANILGEKEMSYPNYHIWLEGKGQNVEDVLTEQDKNNVQYLMAQGEDVYVKYKEEGLRGVETWKMVSLIYSEKDEDYTITGYSGLGTSLAAEFEGLKADALEQKWTLEDGSAIKESWELNSEDRNQYLERFGNNKEDSYLHNLDDFVKDYRDIMDTVGREYQPWSSPIPFVEGPVTGGYLSQSADEPNARGFGVELEFDEANRRDIAIGLYEEGLIDSPGVFEYHEDNDYSQWRVEEDESVEDGGEIVSPILYDNAEDWGKLRRICEVVSAHGGTATIKTGTHVHIGARGMSQSQKKGVLAATAAHQDVIRRIGTNPWNQEHRETMGEGYSSPFSQIDMNSVYDISDSVRVLDRYRMVNFGNDRANTLEFRDADGSLDAGHIQAQVTLAAALTAAGERGSWDDLTEGNVKLQKIGANATREEYLKTVHHNDESSDDHIIATNISLITTLDSLFPDKETKKRMLNAALRSPWQIAKGVF